MADEQEKPRSRGVAGVHPGVGTSPLIVGPATTGEFNTIRAGLIPKACFSLEDSHFEFDSSFINPLGLTFDAGPLKNLLDRHPGFKLSIFGHADPSGKDDYNKTLSGRRAQAVYGLLVRDTDLWADLYYHHDTQGKDPWGVRSIQIMLNAVGPTKTGRSDGTMDTNTRNALKDFEEANNPPGKGFDKKGEIDPGTFAILARKYMDNVCTDDDGNQFQLTPEDFVAGGKGKDGKGDYQGCGEFNPLMMFSKKEKTFFDREENKQIRNKENQINRRVMILLYRPNTLINPDKWPCPSAKEGSAGCIRRFHSDFKDRRSNLDERREHKNEKDNPTMVGTFACRFYERQTSNSPCESFDPATLECCYVYLKLFDHTFNQVLADTTYTLRGVERGFKVNGKTNQDGIVRHEKIPDDHYELICGDAHEVVEPFYLADKPLEEESPWYMRIHGNLPAVNLKLRLFDPYSKPISRAAYRITVDSVAYPVKEASPEGDTDLEVKGMPESCLVEWGYPMNEASSGEEHKFPYSLNVQLDFNKGDEDTQLKRCLHNLGYDVDLSQPLGEQKDVVRSFQHDYMMPKDEDGKLGPKTKQKIRDVHDSCEPTPKPVPVGESSPAQSPGSTT